jgi:hypothetical protein
MSPFILEIPKHAAERLKLRKVSRNLVRRCITRGELIEVRANGRKIRHLRIGQRILEVVYLDRVGGFILVSCYWEGEFP